MTIVCQYKAKALWKCKKCNHIVGKIWHLHHLKRYVVYSTRSNLIWGKCLVALLKILLYLQHIAFEKAAVVIHWPNHIDSLKVNRALYSYLKKKTGSSETSDLKFECSYTFDKQSANHNSKELEREWELAIDCMQGNQLYRPNIVKLVKKASVALYSRGGKVWCL